MPRRIETHVRLCVLALLIERVAELSCNKPWHQIREALDRLQVTKFENSSHRFFHRNELAPETANILKLLKINTPKQVLEIEKTCWKVPNFVDTRQFSGSGLTACNINAYSTSCFYGPQTQVRKRLSYLAKVLSSRSYPDSTTFALRIENVDITGFDGLWFFQVRWRYPSCNEQMSCSD